MTSTQGTCSGLPIIQYWHSNQVPREVAEPMATFRDRNPKMRHLVFNEATAEELIAEHFTTRELEAFSSCAVPAMQADYFRYCAVLALGGVYADAIFSCLHPLEALLEPGDEGVLFRRTSTGALPNGFFMFTAPGHPLLRLAVDVATENIERRVVGKIHIVTGPWVFHLLSKLNEIGSIEAAREEVAGRRFERLVDSVTHAVGRYERVSEAFERVRIVPLDIALNCIARPTARPQYKLDGNHWTDWHKQGRDIFR